MVKSLWAVALGLVAGILAAAFLAGKGPFRRVPDPPPGVPVVASVPAAAPAPPSEAPRETRSPDQIRIGELLRANAGLESDPALTEQYREINARYFNGALPPVNVRWEPRLADVGPLIAEDFRLEGATDAEHILLNPAIRSDEAGLRRVLVHEMVHVAVRHHHDGHGPVFQTFLRQLSEKGAFSGVVSTDEEKQALRASLDAQSAALKTDSDALAKARAEIESAKPSAASEVDVLNARIAEYNARVQRHNAASEAFNRGVERYNLMIVYPDGLDRERYERRSPIAVANR